jgi:hypothetical protein
MVGVAVTAATSSSPVSAYAIARLGLPWTQVLLKASVASRMIPLIVLMVPLYVMFRRYGLLNSLWGVIVAEIGFLIPYAVLILTPYFGSLPSELEDAARIDGCTRFTAFLRVLLPLATPGLAACGVILFVISWHELLHPAHREPAGGSDAVRRPLSSRVRLLRLLHPHDGDLPPRPPPHRGPRAAAAEVHRPRAGSRGAEGMSRMPR